MSKEPESADGPFQPTVLATVVAGVACLFALSVFFATFTPTPIAFGTTIDSPSAIGHKGFYVLLQRLSLPVGVNRLKGPVGTGRNGLLIAQEPTKDVRTFPGSGFRAAPDVLVILPKWIGRGDPFQRGWISAALPIDLDVARGVLRPFDQSATIERVPPPKSWTRNLIGSTPALGAETQVIVSRHLRPLIADGDHILLAEFSTLTKRVWILADPDPLENHGLAKPANTAFALAVLQKLRRTERAPIVFDETIHGAVAPERNPIALLFHFPFVIVTTQTLAALVLLLLATTARFGGPQQPPPAIAPGNRQLIDMIAALIDRGGHRADLLRRYKDLKIADAARRLHAPAQLDATALGDWLDRVAARRGLTPRQVARSAAGGGGPTSPVAILDEAQAIFRWHRDLTDGTT